MAARGPLASALETEGSEGQGPVPNKRIKIEAAATELVGGTTTDAEEKQREMASASAAAAGEGSNALPAAPTTLTQPIPASASTRRRRISKPAAKDPREDLPTVVKPEDPDTCRECGKLKRQGADPGCGTLSHGKVIEQQTGIVIGWKLETKKCARILTSSDIVDERTPTCKLHIGLPNRTVLEGQLLFFNKHYDIALLEISSESDLPLQLPTFGSNPNYGQDVFILARGKNSNLMARHGIVLWLNKSKYANHNYYMFLSCEPSRYGTGGPVIDHDGNVTGMAFDHGDPNTSILAISTILTCIKMWMQFSRIARPVHGLHLRTIELLEVSLQEVISLDHNINNGYIVDKVSIGSTAEKLGIRYGDVIVSFDGLRDQTLPQLEDYLLSLGWGFLQGSTNSSSTVDLDLNVYDLLERCTRSVTLSVDFCDTSE